MAESEMLAVAQGLAEAKSRQHVGDALKFLHPNMVLETPAFGTVARGLAENERALTRFFKGFSDYRVSLDGHVGARQTLVCWGMVRMTLTGNRLGESPNGKTANLPVYIHFDFADGLILRERFCFDLSELCAQSGISTDGARRVLFGAAGASDRPPTGAA